MKLTDLKDWDKLTPEEQKRLREMYGDEPEITQTMANVPPAEAKKKGESE